MRRNARGSTWNLAASSHFCRPDAQMAVEREGATGATLSQELMACNLRTSHETRWDMLKYHGARTRWSLIFALTSDDHCLWLMHVHPKAVDRRCSPSCWRGSHGILGTWRDPSAQSTAQGSEVIQWGLKQAQILFQSDGFGSFASVRL